MIQLKALMLSPSALPHRER
jgi:hypothetical protein